MGVQFLSAMPAFIYRAGRMDDRSVTGFLRAHQQTFWLMAAQFVWGAVVSGTFLSAWVLFHHEQGDSETASFMPIMVVASVIFGFASYRISRRAARGPQRPVTRPYLRYFGYSLLATFLAESVHVFGGVCVLDNTPFRLVLLTFFVPAWLLFAMGIPTRARITRWANARA